jgi:hypothetical protein
VANRAIKSIAWIFVVLAIMTIAAAAYVVFAINSGPLSVSFLKDTVRERVSDSIPGVRLDLDDVVIERGDGSSHPTLRLANVRLSDTDGNLIARAPRAAIAVDIGEILSGKVKPRRLELIGARILARRKADGSIAMGFSSPVAKSGKSDAAGVTQEPSDQASGAESIGADESAGSLAQIISRVLQGDGGNGAASTLEAIDVTGAQISFKDEIQDHLWLSPRADLRFKRAEGGFAVFVDADISADGPTWRTELLTTFRADSSIYRVVAKVYDVTPADLARKLFSFNQLANLNLPLSGEMQFDINDKGTLLAASGVLAMQAGKVSFPDYIADPVLIDEGLVRLAFEPATGHLVINNSTLVIRGAEARFAGRIAPVHDAQQRITAARIELNARNLNIDTPNARPGERASIDEFKLRGQAMFDERKFVVDDLIVLSGKGGVRVRGQFIADGDAVGVYIAGRGRSLDHEIIRKLWPPVMAPQSRGWYRNNLAKGRVDDAEFRVRLSGSQIRQALDGKPLPADAVDLKFSASGVEFTYADGLPRVTEASGSFHLTGTVFDIDFDKARVPLPSGKALSITGGNMQITKLALPISPATMTIRLDGDVSSYGEYADLPPLELVKDSNFDITSVSGRGLVTLKLAMPLKPGITSADFDVSAEAKLVDGRIRNAIEGVDLESATIDISLQDTVITGKGKAKLGDKQARISWRRPLTKSANADEDLTLAATLTDRDRQKLGINLDPYLVGPTPVEVTMVRRGGEIVSARVKADLSKTRMELDALGWSRAPTKGTKASFAVDMGDGKVIKINDLAITGNDLRIVGKVRVARQGGLIDASLPRFILSKTNQLALEVDNADGNLRLGVGGASLDARPLISRMMSSTVAKPGEASEPPVSINTNISRIYVHRGELVNNLKGQLIIQGGAVQQSELSGTYANGAPITMRIVRDGSGQRRMRVTGRDAGATLRAVNLYSKIAGGTINFGAILGNPGQGAIQRGLLEVRNFTVQNEAALSTIDSTTRQAGRGGRGPRANGLRLSRLSVPFSVDNSYVRIGDALVQGPEIGASAQGIIRKQDLAMDIGGTIIPAYALNSAISNVPLVGDILTGGKGQGVFGLNFALQGSMNQPRFLVNPVSAIAPGIFRNIFNIGGGQTNADGTARKGSQGTQQRQRTRQLQSTR